MHFLGPEVIATPSYLFAILGLSHFCRPVKLMQKARRNPAFLAIFVVAALRDRFLVVLSDLHVMPATPRSVGTKGTTVINGCFRLLTAPAASSVPSLERAWWSIGLGRCLHSSLDESWTGGDAWRALTVVALRHATPARPLATRANETATGVRNTCKVFVVPYSTHVCRCRSRHVA